ncbi:MAG: hypothetical protein V1916_03360 [Patescibacteria group bacterium]
MATPEPNTEEQAAAAEPIDHGEVLVSWEFPDIIQYRRSRNWYIITALVTLGMVVFAIFTQSYIFLVIIAILLAIYTLEARRNPITKSITISEDGVQFDEGTFHEWVDIKNFWIIYEPPEVKNLHFSFKATLRPSFAISLEDQNPVDVRKHLLQYIPEDTSREHESFIDGLTRFLKL